MVKRVLPARDLVTLIVTPSRVISVSLQSPTILMHVVSNRVSSRPSRGRRAVVLKALSVLLPKMGLISAPDRHLQREAWRAIVPKQGLHNALPSFFVIVAFPTTLKPFALEVALPIARGIVGKGLFASLPASKIHISVCQEGNSLLEKIAPSDSFSIAKVVLVSA